MFFILNIISDTRLTVLVLLLGGELLRQEAGFYNQIKNTKKSSQRLKDALVSILFKTFFISLLVVAEAK
jgi:hypothetical protein